MAKSTVSLLSSEIRGEIRLKHKNGETYEKIAVWIGKTHDKIVSKSAISRWMNNQKAQDILDQELTVKEVLDHVQCDEDIPAEKVKKLYALMATNHIAQSIGNKNMETKDLISLGKLIKELFPEDSKEVAKEQLSDDERIAKAAQIATGG